MNISLGFTLQVRFYIRSLQQAIKCVFWKNISMTFQSICKMLILLALTLQMLILGKF